MENTSQGKLRQTKMLSRYQEYFWWAIFLTSLILAGYGQFRFVEKELTAGVLSFGGATILFALAMRRHRRPEPESVSPFSLPRRAIFRLFGASALFLSLLAILASLWLFRGSVHTPTPWHLYLGAMILFPAGFLLWSLDDQAGWRRRLVHRLAATKWELLLVVLILAAGAYLRLVNLEGHPFGIWFDESENGIWAREILQRDDFLPLYVPAANRTLHILYLFALSFKLFGVGIGTLRLVTALFGVATILSTWLLGRELGGRRMGLIAAALMAGSHWAINFSRMGMDGITTPFFATVSAWALLRGLRTGSRFLASLGGAALGLGMCIYSPFLFFPLVIALFMAGKFIGEKGFWRKGGEACLIFAVGAVIAFAPVGDFALREHDEFFKRTRQASLFKEKTPEQVQEALKGSLRRHILMFNYEGDRNGRHNLPGEPQLDPYAGALLPLGLALAGASVHRPRQLLLSSWMLFMLLPGVFSLEFEAPQSLRAIGTLPVAVLLVAQVVPAISDRLMAPLAGMRSIQWRRSVRLTQVGGWLLAGAVLLGLGVSARYNIHLYFVRQPADADVFHAFNARETYLARRLVAEGDRYRFYSIYFGHPTVRFLAPQALNHRPFQSIDDLPVRGLVDRDVIYVMEPEFVPPVSLFQHWYPQGELGWFYDVAGKKMLFTYHVTQEEINNSQGLLFRQFDTRTDELLLQEPTTGIHHVWDFAGDAPSIRGEWVGQIFIPQSGRYMFHLRSPGQAEFFLSEQSMLSLEEGAGEVGLELSKGWRSIRVVAQAVPGGEVSMEWTHPDSRRERIPRESLIIQPPLQNGLYARYYPGEDWSGLPAFERIDPLVDFRWHIQPLSPPFCVEWEGFLHIDQAGPYSLALTSNHVSWLELDGIPFIENLEPPYGYREGLIYLEAGVYPLRLGYKEMAGYSEMRLQWRRPDGWFEPIPLESLSPSQPAVSGRTSAQLPYPFGEEKHEMVAPTIAAPLLDVEKTPAFDGAVVLAVWGREGSKPGEFTLPRGIAFGPQGWIYVADAGNGRVQVFDSGGGFLSSWTGGRAPFIEPCDVVVDEAGRVYVLDTVRQVISRFSLEGRFEREIGAAAEMYAPRGLGVDSGGGLYIADTGGNRILRFSPAGELKSILAVDGTGKGGFVQPTDVAVDHEGRLFVAEPLASRLQVLDTQGLFLGGWAISGANTSDSPHLALTQDGWILVTDPEAHQVLVFDTAGNRLGAWGERGVLPGQFHKTHGVAAGAADVVAVTDVYNHRVQLFQLIPMVQ